MDSASTIHSGKFQPTSIYAFILFSSTPSFFSSRNTTGAFPLATTTTPSPSPTIIPPGWTGKSPQEIGKLISPGPSLCGLSELMPVTNTGVPTFQIPPALQTNPFLIYCTPFDMKKVSFTFKAHCSPDNRLPDPAETEDPQPLSRRLCQERSSQY
jgi:hypothetical protein